MTTPPPDKDAQDQIPLQYSTGGGTVTTLQPNELAYPLRMEEFLTLSDGGDSNMSAQWRNFCLASFLNAGVGFIGLLATVDIGQAVVQKNFTPLEWTGVLGFLTVVSGVLAVFFHIQSKKSGNVGAYVRLKRKITEALSVGPVLATGDTTPVLGIVSAKYGAGEIQKDVTSLLAAKIEHGKLQVAVSNKELCGGDDPVPNVHKRLEVSYQLNGKIYSKSIEENEVLSIP